ncbi:MAG: PQQ-binding-like beta-propeller repeat protein [Planctomycetia bacterium]|nr:PQQ-binding-like beta-propeller repeat protein [Planctomycetia bacterium]
MLRRRLVVLAVLAYALCTLAADWPQYRGPSRNDISSETGLLTTWPKGGPTLLWTYNNAGVGYSGPAIVGDRLFTIGGRGEDEFVFALDLKNFKDGSVNEAWAAKVGPLFTWKGNNWSAGPSATPTVDGDVLYALGGLGDLVCVDVKDGKERWRKSMAKELDGEVNPIGGGPAKLGWGYTWSPLVDGDKLICTPGGPKGTVAALDKKTGQVLWRSTELTDQCCYASPQTAVIHGVKQYVILTNAGLAGVSAQDGQLLWNYKRQPRYTTEVINIPLVQDNLVYATVGAGNGCDLIRLELEDKKFKVETIYSNKTFQNHHGGVVLREGHVFGSVQQGWACQELKDGKVAWTDKKLRPGSTTFADGHFYCYCEFTGETALVEFSTKEWKEKGRFTIPQKSKLKKPSGQIWTPPVVANGRLYLRDQELLFCFDIKAK